MGSSKNDHVKHKPKGCPLAPVLEIGAPDEPNKLESDGNLEIFTQLYLLEKPYIVEGIINC